MPKGVYEKSNNGAAVKDHLGNEFISKNAMCGHYGIPASTFRNRLLRGWTLEQALTVPTKGQMSKIKPKKQIWEDHLGNEYISLPEMCAKYGITEKIYQSRRRICKWSLEKTLTTPIQTQPSNAKKISDHLGNEFASISEMCRYHNVKRTQFRERVKKGWDIEKALTEPARVMNDMSPSACEDHLGNKYQSKNEMCRAYGITRSMLNSRLDLGWSLEETLTKPKVIHKIGIVDSAGREFPTLKDMANFYCLGAHQIQGLDIEAIFRELPKFISNKFKAFDLGNGIKITKCLSWPYFIADIYGREHVLHIERVLEIYHDSDIFDPLPATGVKPFIEIKERLGFPYYLTVMDGREIVMSYWEIIKINADENFGLGHKPEKQDKPRKGGKHKQYGNGT